MPAINDLKANGFAGETSTHVIRENLPAEAPQGPQPLPAVEVAKDVAIGAVAGAILGALADWVVGMSLTWPSYSFNHHLPAAVLTLAVAGAIVGLLAGLAAAGSLEPARRALLMHRSEDAMVLFSTDETHAVQAMELLRAAGTREVRRGATSPGEYRVAEGVRRRRMALPSRGLPATLRRLPERRCLSSRLRFYRRRLQAEAPIVSALSTVLTRCFAPASICRC